MPTMSVAAEAPVATALANHFSKPSITLLWMHGGEYCFGSALFMLATLLRLAELSSKRDINLNILSVEYTLAPSASFPKQQDEAVAAYKYLIEHEHIDAKNIIVGGDSAGGHLAMACLVALSQQGLPRPRAALLVCPWANLTNSGATFIQNKYLDGLDKAQLDDLASKVLKLI
ncbi:Alpha/Beta hydrolase protein [Ilyonectria destructans]|nr:Alpha/Beta hydrolase protein [Ilyonectria destructans]